jgi:hypothetical protein
LDSGASHNLSPYKNHFTIISPSSLKGITLADGSSIPVSGKGPVLLKGENGPTLLNEVHLVPNISMPLLSVAAIYNQGGRVEFRTNQVLIYLSQNSKPDLIGKRQGNAWILDSEPQNTGEAKAVWGDNIEKAKGSWLTWHARLGHTGLKALQYLQKQDLEKTIEIQGTFPSEHECIPCYKGKMSNQPFKKGTYRRKHPLELIHSDLMGPIEVLSIRGQNKYVLTCIDDATRYVWIYFLQKNLKPPIN